MRRASAQLQASAAIAVGFVLLVIAALVCVVLWREGLWPLAVAIAAVAALSVRAELAASRRPGTRRR